MNEKNSEPSYAIAAVGGVFLGVLAATILLIFYQQSQWVLAVVPVAGLLAGLLGTYVAAEPYVELKESYEKLMASSVADRSLEKAEEGPAGERVLTPGIVEAAERMNAESLRLAREAAELGEDGLKIAEAAETLRREAVLMRNLRP